MLRSFAEAMGVEWPPEVAAIETDVSWRSPGRHIVTWAELHERRREHQAEILERIRRVELPPVLPCYVWTFFNRQMIPYHGWHCYVVTRHFDVAVTFRGFNEPLAMSIMQAVPCGLLPCPENFDLWMESFASKHPRRKRKGDPRKAGSIIGWLEGRCRFTLEKP